MSFSGDYIKIGEFARRARLPASTLRYYDKIGLLAPALCDPSTGYRWYSRDQLVTARRISTLRGIGLPPDRIKSVIGGGRNARCVLQEERGRLARAIDQSTRQLRQLDELILDQPTQQYAPVEVILPSLPVMTLLFTIASDELERGIRESIQELSMVMKATAARRCGPWGAILPLDIGSDITGKTYAPIDEPLQSEPFDVERLPNGQALEVVHNGSLRTVDSAYCAIFDEFERRRLVAQGPILEEYKGYLTENDGQVTIRIRFQESF